MREEIPKGQTKKANTALKKSHIYEIRKASRKIQGTGLPKNLTGKAIGYALGQEKSLMNVFLDPRLELTNNAAERGVRPIVVGRKNWLFAHSERGAEAAAMIYSIVETAKAANIKIFDYFRYIFDALRSCSFKKLDELLPWAGGAKFSLSVGGEI